MAKRVIDDSTLTAVADKIRERVPDLSGTSITPLEIPEKIDDVYDKGRQEQYDEFWTPYLRVYSQNGGQAKRIFGSRGWNDDTFRPPIGWRFNCTNAEGFFQENQVSDIKKILEERNVVFNFSKCLYFDYFAYYSASKHFPEINMSSATAYSRMFDGCSSLVTIDKLVVNSTGTQTFSNQFTDCKKLANIVIEGTIGRNFDIRYSPLTKDSITSIINALSSTETGRTLSLKKTAVHNAFTVCAANFESGWNVGNAEDEGTWQACICGMGVGDLVEIGECVYISCADNNIIVRKTDDDYLEGRNEGIWELVACGTDVKDEWGDLVKSKPNWTINLI